MSVLAFVPFHKIILVSVSSWPRSPLNWQLEAESWLRQTIPSSHRGRPMQVYSVQVYTGVNRKMWGHKPPHSRTEAAQTRDTSWSRASDGGDNQGRYGAAHLIWWERFRLVPLLELDDRPDPCYMLKSEKSSVQYSEDILHRGTGDSLVERSLWVFRPGGLKCHQLWDRRFSGNKTRNFGSSWHFSFTWIWENQI